MGKMKQVEIGINIKADTGNKSKMVLVFNEDYPTDMFNAIKFATHQLTNVLMNRGLLTKAGVSPAEMKDYIEYMTPIVQETEIRINKLYRVLKEVEDSDLEYKFVIMEIIQKQIDDAWKLVDEFNEMFEEIGEYNPLEFEEGITDVEGKDNE